MEIGNLPEKKFRIMIVNMIQHLGKRMEAKIEKMQDMFNKDLEELKNKQTEMKNTITEMKNTLKGINIRIIGVQEEEEKKKGTEKIFEEIIVETSLIWERKQSTKSRKRGESHVGGQDT